MGSLHGVQNLANSDMNVNTSNIGDEAAILFYKYGWCMFARSFGAISGRFGKYVIVLAKVLFRHVTDRAVIGRRAKFQMSTDFTDKYTHKTLLFSCF